MTTDQSNPILIQSLQSTPHDFRQDRRIDALLRKTRDRQRGNRRSRHGPNIVNRIQCCNSTIVVRVVDNRREEVERLHEREVVAKTVYARVVGCIETDNQIWIVWLFW